MSVTGLLPTYAGRKTYRKICFVNERLLMTALFVSTIFTFIFLYFNLPSNVKQPDIVDIIPPPLNSSTDGKRHQVHSADKPISLVTDYNINIDENFEPDNVRMKRDTVKNMTLFAWNSYKKYAWGKNELKPLSKHSHHPGMLGSAENLGLTIVDALDTLHIMGLQEQFEDGSAWIKENFNININTEMSLFEVNIRYIGGFLSLYTLTKNDIFLDKAVEVANATLPAFDTKTGLPYSSFNPSNPTIRPGCSVLAEVGTLSLEFQYLTDLTGIKIYQEKIEKIYDTLFKINKDDNLYYNYVNVDEASWCSRVASMGAMGDSFYEYLLKYWLYTNRKDQGVLDAYLKAMKAIRNKLVGVSKSGYTYLGEFSGNRLEPKMGHLACFSGGLFALTRIYVEDLTPEERSKYESLAEEITRTCHESYIRMPTHIGPEGFYLMDNYEFAASESYYILRPEVVESYFYLWRMTKDPKYRDWAWDAVQAIEKHCRTDGGYSGLKNVNSEIPEKDDVQQSFFFAETLKYLYLIFSDDDVLPLDKYVFNTEAHPFLIRK